MPKCTQWKGKYNWLEKLCEKSDDGYFLCLRLTTWACKEAILIFIKELATRDTYYRKVRWKLSIFHSIAWESKSKEFSNYAFSKKYIISVLWFLRYQLPISPQCQFTIYDFKPLQNSQWNRNINPFFLIWHRSFMQFRSYSFLEPLRLF